MAKKILFSLLIVFLVTIVSAQVEQKEYFEKKISHYKEMQKKGKTYQIIGGVSALVGIVSMSAAEWDCYSYGMGGSCDSDDPKAVVGALCLIGGISFGVTGVIYSSIGIKKIRQYKRIIENLSIGISPNSKTFEFQLVYKF